MKITMRTILNLSLCLAIFVICLILMALLSGFHHEYKKYKQLILTLVAVFVLRYAVLDNIIFLLQALFLALRDQVKYFSNENKIEQNIEPEAENYEFDSLEFLKIRLISLKSQLSLDKRHRDESLNWRYNELTEELWLFGKYLFLLLLVVVYTHNVYAYYNTAIMRRVLHDSYSASHKKGQVLTIGDLYSWINSTLTGALCEGRDYDGRHIDEPGWLNFYQSKLLGVVRLQQLRHTKKEHRRNKQYFDKQNYLPGWKEFNRTLHYMDKYWRTYYPWLGKHYEGFSKWLLASVTIGSLYTYSENNGYVVLLARDQANSRKILNFLKAENWLDAQTAAVFIDFTLYNADSNIFTICCILVEQTPFGNLLWQINVQSVELLWNMNEVTMWWWLVIVLYAFQLIQLCKTIILRAWFFTGFFKSRWNSVDLVIVLLNILLLSFVLLREHYVRNVMNTFALAQKQEHVDFRVACVFNDMTNIILGLLICLASIRTWKILQFSSIFRIFNRTLYNSLVPLISTIFGIHIILLAIGKSAQILNGSNSEIFSGYLKSVTSIMSFSFGFNSATSPDDLSHGGNIFGFILYIILMFVVAIFLINMFITLICDHFANAREERDHEPSDQLNYRNFLTKEYSFIAQFFNKFFSAFYKTNNKNVSQNINDYLDKLEIKVQVPKTAENLKRPELTNAYKSAEEKKKIDRLQNVANVLNLQLELLDRVITFESFDWDLEHEDSD